MSIIKAKNSISLVTFFVTSSMAAAPLMSRAQDVIAPIAAEKPAGKIALNARLELKRATEALVERDRIGAKMTPEQEADLLQRNSEATEILRRALELPFEAEAPNQANMNTMFEPLAGYRWLARLLALQSRVQARQNDFPAATQSAINALRLGHLIQNGGSIMTSLNGQALEGIGRGVLIEALPKLDATTAKSLARQIETLEKTRRSWARILEGDSKSQQVYLQMAVGKEKQLEAMAIYDQLMEWQIAQAEVPYLISEQRVLEDRHAQVIAEQEAEEKNAPNDAPPPDVNTVVEKIFKMSSSVFPSTRLSFERNRTSNLLLMTQLSLHAFELDNKRAAKSLDELVPNYLSRVPFDPFGVEETLQWKERDGKQVLYSIGPDGLDDGGKTPPTVPVVQGRPPRLEASSRGDIVAGINAR